MNNKYKLSDNVIGRIAQIIQESMLLGIDAVDLMRQIEIEPSGTDTLELTSTYVKSVKDMHVKLLEEAERLDREQHGTSTSKIIFNG
jgi:hypothetical protein